MPERFKPTDVEQLARLARLRLSEAEIARFAEQLTRIIAYADAVQQVNTADIPPTSHPLAEGTEHLREDRAGGSLPRDQALAAAPDADQEAGLFRVPRVL